MENKKSFRDYKKEYEEQYNKGLNNTGVFWAFSDEQFNENKTHKEAEDKDYISVGMGGYLHKSNKEKFKHFIEVEAKELKKEFTSKININDFIDYELANHECYYTGEYNEVEEIIKAYYEDLTDEEIHEKVKNIYYQNIDKYEF